MRRALITGGGKRLGRAMAEYLAGRGIDVAVHYHASADGAEQVVEFAHKAGVQGVALQADLLDGEQTTALVPDAMRALGGPIDLLVNNASIFEMDTIESLDEESWQRHLDSNLKAPVILTQAMAEKCPEPTPDENGEPVAQGLVVNMIDQRVRKLTPKFMSYTLAKSALWTFTRTAAQGLAPRVRVNAIGPGPTLQGERQSREQFERQRRSTLLERGANSGDITAALGFFIDAKAVTGQLICVDGGQHLNWKTADILGPE